MSLFHNKTLNYNNLSKYLYMAIAWFCL